MMLSGLTGRGGVMKLAMKLLLFLFVALCLVGSASAADIWVSTPVTHTTINTAIASASAGDVVIIPDGTYTNLGQIEVPSTVDGTESNPIILKAETKGGVIMKGNPAGLRMMFIEGDWWVIQDFQFINISEVGDANTYGIITRDATGTRITNNYWEGFGVLTNTNKNSWPIWIGNGGTGNYSRIDYNTFFENEALGVTISPTALHCQIDHNHFKAFLQDGDNGFSAIQTGYHTSYYVNLYTIVEYNLFENMNADPETISSKSSSNTFRYNVFKSTNGTVAYGMVLRAGDDCIVESNYFFDVDKQNLRVHGTGHKIINNYFENPDYSAILLTNGDNGTTSGYANVEDIFIADNTIVNPIYRGIHIGWWAACDVKPDNLTFKNNIIISDVAGSYLVRDDGHTGTFTWTTNLHYATGTANYWLNNGGGDEPGTGITHANPNLTTGYGIQRLQASSTNAIEQGTPDGNVTDDIDGQVRDDTNPDIGCDEYNTSAPLRLPVTVDDVGHDFSAAESPTSYDNVIKLSATDTVYSDVSYNGVGGIGAVDSYRRSWIWFNLSEYNSTDIIDYAPLNLTWFYNGTGRNKSTNVGIYFANATTDTDYLTWNNSSNGVAWREPGGNWLDANWADNGTTPFASVLLPNTAPDFSSHSFDITELVQAIVNESRTNNGFFIIANETNTNYIAFSSLDNATEAHQPTLNITHSIAGADTPETSDFTYYKIITLNQSMINQSIGTGKYPLLVSNTDTDLRDHCQADGDDIVFFDSDNTTLLPYEQEFWNSTTGKLVEWVGIEDATNVSYIVMYYNNSTIANSENITGVWDSNYMMVQHFQETDIDGGAGDIKDSTSNDNDGNTHNMTSANLDTGLIDGCFNFSVSNEARVNVSDDSTLDGFTSGFTISGLFNFNQEGAYYLVNKYDAGGDQRAWLLKLEGNDNLRIYVDDAGTAAEISNFNPTIVPGTDYKIDAVWESGEYPILYVNGALANEVDHDGLVSSIKDSSAILRIAGGYSPGNTYFTGDEIRVSNIGRSQAYLETDTNNTLYPGLFISIGSEQGGGTPDTKYEYWSGSAWTEGVLDIYIDIGCFWWTPICDNIEQTDGQPTLKITNNGTASGTPKMKLNESAPAGIRIFVDDDNTFADAVELSNTYQAVSTSLTLGTNVTLWAWANLSGAPAWEFETEAIVE